MLLPVAIRSFTGEREDCFCCACTRKIRFADEKMCSPSSHRCEIRIFSQKPNNHNLESNRLFRYSFTQMHTSYIIFHSIVRSAFTTTASNNKKYIFYIRIFSLLPLSLVVAVADSASVALSSSVRVIRSP